MRCPRCFMKKKVDTQMKITGVGSGDVMFVCPVCGYTLV